MRQLFSPHNFFDALPENIQDELNAASTFINIEKGACIIKAGTQPEVVCQLISGQVKYFSSDLEGRGKVLIVMGKGDWIGLAELFTQLPAPWDVTAITPVKLRKVNYRDFNNLLDKHPPIARQLLKIFSLRFRFFSLFDLDHSALTLRERVIKVLYLLSTSFDNGDRSARKITLKVSQEELSMIVGASRQKVNAELKAVQQEGLLTLHYGSITLIDRAKLRDQHQQLFSAAPFL